jgi:hypothetical protein
MKRKTRALIIALCTLVFVTMIISPALYAADEVTITGVVFSSEGIIRTADRQEYTVEIDAMGVDLIDEDRKKVEVRGTVEEKEGKKIIKVIKYRVVK